MFNNVYKWKILVFYKGDNYFECIWGDGGKIGELVC